MRVLLTTAEHTPIHPHFLPSWPAKPDPWEDADDCDALRADPVFKMAAGRAPESGRALCSQPTMSRLENAPTRTEMAHMTAALVDLFCRSFGAPPAAARI